MLIPFAYYKVFWKRTTLLANLVFIQVFNFLACNLALMQALSHFYCPFLDFLV